MMFPKCETKKRLDSIAEMSDDEIAINANFIRETASAAVGLIRQWDGIIRKYKKPSRRTGLFNKVTDSYE